MEDLELRELWEESNQNIERSKILNLQTWVLHLKTFEYIQTEKAKSRLNALSSYKKWVILLGILWVAFLLLLVAGSLTVPKIFFAASVAAIAGFSLYAVVVYIRHTILIREIDNSESLVEAQEKTATLKASTLQTPRILFLQTPFYSTFFWSLDWMKSDVLFWLIAFPITILLTILSLWLYRNINYRNADKKWFKLLFSSKEWTSVIKAMNYLQEIEEYKKQ